MHMPIITGADWIMGVVLMALVFYGVYCLAGWIGCVVWAFLLWFWSRT